MENAKIRMKIMSLGLRNYEAARILGYSETHLSRMLRYELPKEKQHEIVNILEERTRKNGR